MLAGHSDPFSPGDSIAIRDVRGGVVRAVATAVVVEHSLERLVTWIPLGSPLLLPGDAHGQLVKAERVERLIEVAWNSWGGPVIVFPHHGWHSVRASWNGVGADRSLDHWYINLHTPLRRSRYGFDMEDLILDLVVKPDRQSWRWKDEADFDRACAAGVIRADVAAEIRNVGNAVVADARRGTEPFTTYWENWRPDPTWQTPRLPHGCMSL